MSTADAAALLERLADDERRLVLASFDEDVAWQLGTELVETAQAERLPVAIAIRRGAQVLFHAALPGASADNDAWIERKCRVVERYQRSSYAVGTGFRAQGTTFEASSLLDPTVFAAHGGAFPLRVQGAGMVAIVAVSGLPQADDHALVVRVLERLVERSALGLD